MKQSIIMENVTVNFHVPSGVVKAVDNTSISFKKNLVTGLIGESGCGKSVLGLYLLGLLPMYAKTTGNIHYQGIDLTTLSSKKRQQFLGKSFGYIAQNPSESLNPVRKVGTQLIEAILVGEKNKQHAKEQATELLKSFGFLSPEEIMNSYPFQLSGGMQQRVLCAIGLALNPPWVLADEPTKGLDASLAQQVTETFQKIKKEHHSMILITHDIVFADALCDEIAVMYSGQIVEQGKDVFKQPLHPYTHGFLQSLPRNGMIPMRGRAPALTEHTLGCKFANRCPKVMERCKTEVPLLQKSGDHLVRCHYYD